MNRSRWIYLTIFVLAALGLSGYVSSGPATNPSARHAVLLAAPRRAAAQAEIVVVEAGKAFTVSESKRVHALLQLSPATSQEESASFQVSISSTVTISDLLDAVSVSLHRGTEQTKLTLLPSTQPLQAPPTAFAARGVRWQTGVVSETIVMTTQITATTELTRTESWRLELFALPLSTTVTIAVGEGTIREVEADPIVVVTQTTHLLTQPALVTLSGYGMRNIHPPTSAGCDVIEMEWQAPLGAPPITTTTQSTFIGGRRVCLTTGTLLLDTAMDSTTANDEYRYSLVASVGDFSDQAQAAVELAVPPTSTPAPTNTPTPSNTRTPTPTSTRRATRVPTSTSTPSRIPTITRTPTPTRTATPTVPADAIYGRITYIGTPVPNIPVAYNTVCNSPGLLGLTVTDHDGRYMFRRVPPGNYWVLFNGWNNSAVPVAPFGGSCAPDFMKVSGQPQEIDWELNKNDLHIIFPSADAVINSLNPVFVWEPYPEATSYDVVLSKVYPSFESLEFGTASNGTTFQAQEPLESGATYEFIVWGYGPAPYGQFVMGEIRFSVK